VIDMTQRQRGDPVAQRTSANTDHSPHFIPLGEKVNPVHTAFVVIDYQNDFVSEDGAFARTGSTIAPCRAIAPGLRESLTAARNAGTLVIFVRSIYNTDDCRYLSRVMLHQTWRTQNGRFHSEHVCEEDSWGAEFFEDIHPEPGDPVVTKHRFSAFYNTDLELILRSCAIETLVLTGVTTDTCIESTARDAYFRDFFVVIPRECVGCQSVERQEGALQRLDRQYGEVVALKDILRTWTRAANTPDGELAGC
jgi:ureidoacrylate peracid hydrolase